MSAGAGNMQELDGKRERLYVLLRELESVVVAY